MQITDNTHALKIAFPSTAGAGRAIERFVHVYFIYGPKITLIDGGVAAAFTSIGNYLTETGRNLKEIDLLVQTHSHPDHIGSSAAIKKASGCRTAAHRDAKPWIEDIDLQYRSRPTGTFYTLVSDPVGIDLVLTDGDILELPGGGSLEVLHTPGHSRDSISLYYPKDGVLFTGDTIPVIGDRPVYDDLCGLVGSLKKMKSQKNIRVLCSSWHPPLYGKEVYETIDNGLKDVQQTHDAVRRIQSAYPGLEPGPLCARILKTLELPDLPNVVKTIETHLAFSRHSNILDL
jgi:glyoxylase-like metal-dependent hydrolase (beta-lactamase superfamily II)